MTQSLLLALAVAAAAQVPGLDQLAGRSAQQAAAALQSLVYSKGSCYDGSDPEVHGAPMCAVALSNDPATQWSVHAYLSGRGHREPSDTILIHKKADGDVHIVIDPQGGVKSAERRLKDGGSVKLSVEETRAELEATAAAVKAQKR